MSDTVQHVSDASFETDVIQASQPVLVDFTATWCGPCKMIAPILDQVAGEYSDKVRIVKLDVDDNQATAARYGIRGVPTLMLFKDGAPTETRVGAMSKSQLTQFLDTAL
ncbi:MAG: thioredoxin TrxA [Pigmentiphaga sp.]|nr:thioredoxin TrxA [Pigmentiphaga sp.]